VGSLRAFAAALACALAVPAAAGPLAPSKPSQLVTARSVSTPCPTVHPAELTPYAIDSMTTIDARDVPFAIPPKQAFVITHVHLAAGNATPNTQIGVFLIAVVGTNGGVLAEAAVQTDGAGRGSTSFDLPTGIAVREGTTICGSSADGSGFASVTGYFTKDK
jgi:hypothetical protein